MITTCEYKIQNLENHNKKLKETLAGMNTELMKLTSGKVDKDTFKLFEDINIQTLDKV
jgi:hypothetical protein